MQPSPTRRRLLGASVGVLGSTALASLAAPQGGDSPSPPPDFGGHLDGTSNYDGTVADERGQSTATVRVGVEANGGNFGFGPPAVHVDNGATVRWEWTSDGSAAHSVVSSDDGPLDSGGVTDEPGVNYEYTFENDGIYLYHCAPHAALAMKGAVVVGTDYPRRTTTPTTTASGPEQEGTALAVPPASDWRSREFGPANRSHVPDATGPRRDVREQWRLELPEPAFDPVLADGTVYLSVWDRFGAVAVDAASGERRWESEVDGRVRAVDDDRVYVTSDSGEVFALDAATGEQVGMIKRGDEPVADLQVAAGRVYAAIGDTVHAFDADGGSVEALAAVDGELTGLAVVDGVVYTGEYRNYAGDADRDPELVVRAFDASAGTERWSYSRESFPPTRPTVADGAVYVGSGSHAVVAVDASDGSERWTADLGSSVNGLAVVPDDDGAADGARGTVYAGCNDYHLYAFDADTGERLWRERTRGSVDTPAVAGDVVCASNRGYVHAELDDDGNVETETDGSVERDRAVHGFDAGTGERLWTVELDPLSSTSRTPAYVGDEIVVADGTAYVGLNDTDGRFSLHALTGTAARNRDPTSTTTPTAPTATTDEASATAPAATDAETTEGSPGFTGLATVFGLGIAGWRLLSRSDDT